MSPSRSRKGGAMQTSDREGADAEQAQSPQAEKRAAERASIVERHEERKQAQLKREQERQGNASKLTSKPTPIQVSGAAEEGERTELDDAIDKGLDDVNDLLGELEGAAVGFDRELKEQKKEIEALETGAQAAVGSVQTASKRTGWFLKKL